MTLWHAITVIVMLLCGYDAVQAFKQKAMLRGWLNLIGSSVNLAIILKYIL
jgi:hypothetical protein